MKNAIVMIALAALFSVSSAQSVSPTFSYVHRDQEAKPLNLKKVANSIKYPESQLSNEAGGLVLFRILVDEQGNYRQHQLVSSDNEAFTYQAEAKIKNLKFEPAQLNGKAVRSWIMVPIRFEVFDNRSQTIARY